MKFVARGHEDTKLMTAGEERVRRMLVLNLLLEFVNSCALFELR